VVTIKVRCISNLQCGGLRSLIGPTGTEVQFEDFRFRELDPRVRAGAASVLRECGERLKGNTDKKSGEERGGRV